MANYKVALRYATSLLDLAVEKNLLEVISSDMVLIAETLTKSPDLKRAIENPIIRPETKLSFIDEIFKSMINSETLHFIRFVVKKGRENLISEIAAKYIGLREESMGIVNVEVQVAFELTEDQKNNIQERIGKILAKKALCRIRLNPEVLGGFIAKVNDTVYDASVKHQLVILKQQLLKGGTSLN